MFFLSLYTDLGDANYNCDIIWTFYMMELDGLVSVVECEHVWEEVVIYLNCLSAIFCK